MKNAPPTKHAFSLVELSIVLVILGLLVGGVLAGKSLIRASELRGITSQLQRYVTSIHSFRDKYFYLPGDIPNATSFWGTATVCPGDETQGSTNATTCNGDGDGNVEYFSVSTSHEHYRIWQHLANAGMIEGTYSGVPFDSSDLRSIGPANSPAGKLSASYFTMLSFGVRTSADATFWEGNYNNVIGVGTLSAAALLNSGLRPEELWNIDTKLDDAKPSKGKVQSQKNGACPTSTDPTLAEYDLTRTTTDCRLYYRSIF